MVNALKSSGWNSLVCTVKPSWNNESKDRSLIDLLPEDLQVYRSRPLPLVRLSRVMKIFKLDNFALMADSLPDKSIYWCPPALLCLQKLLKDQTVLVIHSRAMPLAGHFLGLYAKRRSGLPWLVHFSDPWIEGPLYTAKWSFLKKLHFRWEKKIVGTADAVTFTTEAARKKVMAKYPVEWLKKSHVIPHGYVYHPLIKYSKKLFNSNHLNIVYVGSFYGARSPEVLFQALHQLKNDFSPSHLLRIWLIGRMPHRHFACKAKRYGIENLICLKEPVSYKKAMAYAQQADILLTINSIYKDPDLFLESKLIDYFGMNKPILGIVYLSGKTAALLRSMGCFVADIQNPSATAGVLKKIVINWRDNKLVAPDCKKQEVQKYKIEYTTTKLASILNELSEKAGTSLKIKSR